MYRSDCHSPSSLIPPDDLPLPIIPPPPFPIIPPDGTPVEVMFVPLILFAAEKTLVPLMLSTVMA